MSNADTINRFYSAFAKRDPVTMAACYDESAVFSDEAFDLNGKREVAGMWAMLLSTPQKPGDEVWKLEFSNVSASGNEGQAHWDATYRFTATGRLVLNRIDAKFRFNDAGLIVEHRDTFDFWRWARQALGAPGALLGWTPFLRNKVRTQARANLDKFLAK
ncbi:MAG: nuclear transport factor 2 family protein [Rhodocyclaceae bacterium]|nr:nuclear transport factor 2 family protein [Rhodocyclaceae bacterium]